MIFIVTPQVCANEPIVRGFPAGSALGALLESPNGLSVTSKISITQGRVKLDFSKPPSAAREVNVKFTGLCGVNL